MKSSMNQSMHLAITGVKSLTSQAGQQLYGGTTEGNFFIVFGRIIGTLLSVSGIILLGFILVAGFYWMTAGGNEAQVAKAKQLILNATVGLLLLLTAYGIATFVQNTLIDRLLGGPDITQDQSLEEEP